MTNGNARILLVDDHSDTLEMMARLLHLEGYHVTCASTAHAAIECCRQTAFDLFITDIQLPDGSGNDLMRRLHKVCSVPGIALSGLAMKTEVEAGERAGFAEYLTKPVNLIDVKAAIERTLRAAKAAKSGTTKQDAHLIANPTPTKKS